MIDTDKMKQAFTTTTQFCQHTWAKSGDQPGDATKLCALSALIAYAGIQPELIRLMAAQSSLVEWVSRVAEPVLSAGYGIRGHMVSAIVRTFDTSASEFTGIVNVLALCERANAAEQRAAALTEDRERFPQHTCAERDEDESFGVSWSSQTWTDGIITAPATYTGYAFGANVLPDAPPSLILPAASLLALPGASASDYTFTPSKKVSGLLSLPSASSLLSSPVGGLTE